LSHYVYPRKKFALWPWEKTVESLWVELYEREFVELDDVLHIQLWMKALAEIGYKFPGKNENYGNSGRKVNYSVGLPLATSRFDLPKNCLHIDEHPRKFFTSDLHDGTRLDSPTVLASLGQTFVVAGKKGNISPYPSVFRNTSGIVIGRKIPKTVAHYNDHTSKATNKSIAMTAVSVARDVTLSSVDAFYCSFPPAMCELWMGTNKSIVFLAAHRYNLGRCSVERWQLLNKRLLNLSKDSKNTIGGVGRYDYEYLRHYTGIGSARLISSFSGFYTTGHDYHPTKPEIPLLHLKFEKSRLMQQLEAWEGEFVFKSLYDLYFKYVLGDLVSHRAIVFEPYSVMSFKFTEFYSLNIPLFVPSAAYWRKAGGIGQDRTSTSEPYCKTDKGK
jgi:hypothetical protein